MATAHPAAISQTDLHSSVADPYCVTWDITAVYRIITKYEIDWAGNKALGSSDLESLVNAIRLEIPRKCQVLRYLQYSSPLGLRQEYMRDCPPSRQPYSAI